MTAPSSQEAQARRALVRLVRDSGRDVLATLARHTGDLGLAEDAVQDAVLRALETWPRDGVPDNPVAWLRLVARRRAVDLVRREAARRPKEEAAVEPHDDTPDDTPGAGDPWDDSRLDDDLLRLVFTCCHPSLAPTTQVALALRTLCGLDTAEVARALLTTEASMAKRLTRARQKIRDAHIPYRVPADHELPERWAAVLATVYLVFNEGYAAGSGDALVRPALVEEALRLARLLVRLQPDDPDALGLLALLLLQDSRRAARSAPDGRPLLLAEQDRSRWDAACVREGVALVGEALRRSPERPRTYVVQAAIAACHALAPSYDETDWGAVVSWYDVLLSLDDGPVVRLNRAAAVAHRDGPGAGLALMDAIGGLERYPWWHASRAVLLRRLDRHDEAAQADRAAAALPLNQAQKQLLQP
ncbi:RNA polymerase sigma factor [Nocardioides rubriscoriae]|uniref:RNA polymerase sigma factor n=1 Tax=Nocardioides rubriscoriae TaxID=642762 RepID=UPI001FE7B0F5|nr:sigma-70 family RNA polymerase sigma factor [Nocardioides rubriscoriae]